MKKMADWKTPTFCITLTCECCGHKFTIRTHNRKSAKRTLLRAGWWFEFWGLTETEPKEPWCRACAGTRNENEGFTEPEIE